MAVKFCTVGVGRVSAGAIALPSLRGKLLDTGARQCYLHVTLLSSIPFFNCSGLYHRILKVAARSLIIKHFLDNRIAASRFIWEMCTENDPEYLLLFKLR